MIKWWKICLVWTNWVSKYFHKYFSSSKYFQNLSGTIVSIINMLCIAISPNPRTAAIYYFITALFMLLACFDTFFALPLNVSFDNLWHSTTIILYSWSEVLSLSRAVVYPVCEWETEICDNCCFLLEHLQQMQKTADQHLPGLLHHPHHLPRSALRHWSSLL